MAKFKCSLQGDYDQALRFFHNGILEEGTGAQYAEESHFQSSSMRVTVRVYERYSVLHRNWLSLTLTLAGDGEKLYLSGITAGGSGSIFRFATRSEETFLDTLKKLAELW